MMYGGMAVSKWSALDVAVKAVLAYYTWRFISNSTPYIRSIYRLYSQIFCPHGLPQLMVSWCSRVPGQLARPTICWSI